MQIVSGRPRQAMCAPPPSTGPAVASANRQSGWEKSINAAARMRTRFGVQTCDELMPWFVIIIWGLF